MSRSYSIRVPVKVLLPNGTGGSEGTFTIAFTLLEILPPERMKELLRHKLLDKGFVETPEGMSMPLHQGRTAILDLETMTMKITVPMESEVTVKVEEEHLKRFRDRLENALKNGTVLVDERLDSIIEANKSQTVKELKEIALSARKKVNAALKEVYREAVKEKAATLGNVESVSESRDGNTYRIRIEISG
ncbi:MAG: hypothetical protein Kow0029_09360 [Candidatus Rifleibacteriota bacterium]